MKYKTVNVVLLGSIITLMFACYANKEETASEVVDKEQIKNEIQARENEYASIYNTGELKNIGYYADDATSFFQNRAPLVGKEEIMKFLESDLHKNSNTISFKTNEVFPSNDGKQVVEIGYYKVIDSTNIAINSGNYMILFEKRNGKYECLREMSVSDIPIQ